MRAWLAAGLGAALLHATTAAPARALELGDTPEPNPGHIAAFGGTGLVRMPTARMQRDGEINIGGSLARPFTMFFGTVQALPWLEGTFRYTRVDPYRNARGELNDRSFDIKLRLIPEGEWTPQIAIGLQDFVGSGIFAGEYIVASRRVYDFDFTLGMGWGRLGSRGHINNPAGQIVNRFNRPRTVNEGQGGNFRPGQWFAGRDVSFFGGVEWQSPIEGLRVKVEYDGSNYDIERRQVRGFQVTSPVNAALSYEMPSFSASIGIERGRALMLRVGFPLNAELLQPAPKPAQPPMRVRPRPLGATQAFIATPRIWRAYEIPPPSGAPPAAEMVPLPGRAMTSPAARAAEAEARRLAAVEAAGAGGMLGSVMGGGPAEPMRAGERTLPVAAAATYAPAPPPRAALNPAALPPPGTSIAALPEPMRAPPAMARGVPTAAPIAAPGPRGWFGRLLAAIGLDDAATGSDTPGPATPSPATPRPMPAPASAPASAPISAPIHAAGTLVGGGNGTAPAPAFDDGRFREPPPPPPRALRPGDIPPPNAPVAAADAILSTLPRSDASFRLPRATAALPYLPVAAPAPAATAEPPPRRIDMFQPAPRIPVRAEDIPPPDGRQRGFAPDGTGQDAAPRPAGAFAPGTREAAIVELLARERLIVSAIQIGTHSAEVRLENRRFRRPAQAAGRAARVMANLLPITVERIVIAFQEGGLDVARVAIMRRELEKAEDGRSSAIEVAYTAEYDGPAPLPEGAVRNPDRYPAFGWNIGPRFRQNLFDPDKPYRFQVLAGASAEVELRRGLVLSGALDLDVYNNFSGLPQSNSRLPRVRSDIGRYLNASRINIPVLQASYQFNLGSDLYGLVAAGYFEMMFGGFRAEMLYAPYGQRWALGFDINQVWQRNFAQDLGLRGYNVLTGHVSLHYEWPVYGITTTLRAGRYLAKDWGATLEVTRRFASGIEVGLFATRTNISARDFGEGSFDKGVIIRLPLDLFLPEHLRSTADFSFRPLTRDGGQRLGFSRELYGTVREYSPGRFYQDGRLMLD